jgi:hypothetical protein
MIRRLLYKTLLEFADLFESGVKKSRGAAHRLFPEKTTTLSECVNRNWDHIRPCFVLSTGRCGTLSLNRLLQMSPSAHALHRPVPELIRASKEAYNRIGERPELFRQIFACAREELVHQAVRRDRTYIETNNRITFFAPIIRDVFPRAVFIHLVRHPGDFVRSGIRRRWYSGMHDHDLGRIAPLEVSSINWDGLGIVEKIGWLWNETNQFIEDFKSTLPPDAAMTVRAEDLFDDPQVTEKIYSFLDLRDFNLASVRRRIARPVNVQRKGQFDRYQDWNEADVRKLVRIAPLISAYGYSMD